MVLSSTPFHHLEHYPAHNVVVSQWYGPCSSQEYRNTLMQFLHLIEEMRIPYAIADRRLLPPMPAEDNRWTLKEYMEKFLRLPLKRFAFINSFDPVAERQIHRFLENNKNTVFPFEMRVFDDLTSAYDWLITGKERH